MFTNICEKATLGKQSARSTTHYTQHTYKRVDSCGLVFNCKEYSTQIKINLYLKVERLVSDIYKINVLE